MYYAPVNRLPAPLVLLTLALLLSGCDSDPERPEVYPVEGQLSINGQPAEGALISLHPADGQNFDQRGSRPWATVQADGSFMLSTYAQEDGAPAGEYAVSVVWLDNPDSADPVDRLGGRYARPEQSQWRVVIRGGNNTLESYEIRGLRLPGVRPAASGGMDPPE